MVPTEEHSLVDRLVGGLPTFLLVLSRYQLNGVRRTLRLYAVDRLIYGLGRPERPFSRQMASLCAYLLCPAVGECGDGSVGSLRRPVPDSSELERNGDTPGEASAAGSIPPPRGAIPHVDELPPP